MKNDNLLAKVILLLSESDRLTVRRLINGGVLITGGLGQGKSSTSLRQLIFGLMLARLGGLFCTNKSTDTADYLAIAKSAGREKDVIVFSVESGLRFDPLAYLWANGRGARDVEGIIDFFDILLSLGKQHLGVNNDRFWDLAAQQAMRNAIHLIRLARAPLSIVNVAKAIQSFPKAVGEEEAQEWQDSSFTASLIKEIRERRSDLSKIDWKDLEVATDFIFGTWAAYDPKPRGSIEMTFLGMADRFMFSPWREMFASGAYDFTPSQITHEHKLLILDIPILQYGRETSRLMQLIVKLVFQRQWLSHAYKPGCCNGAMLVQDEFQTLFSKFENHFVQVCRGSAIVPIYATQSILNISEEIGESQPGAKTKAFLNNLSIKIAHNSGGCPDTCQYLADTIGKEWRYIDGFNAGESSGHTHTGVSGQKHLTHIVEPIEFTRLMAPDGDNPCAEAIVYLGGNAFEATKSETNPRGRNYLKVTFSREI
jgi:TraM recognition site of TraD and TraG